MPDISVIMPAYNECECLPIIIDEIIGTCRGAGVNVEIIAVDDGSDDGTWEIIQARQDDRHIIGIRLRRNQGMGIAMREGLTRARGEWICFLPSDGQYSPAEMLYLYSERAHFDAVAGEVTFKSRAAADIFIRALLSKGMRFLMKIFHPNMPGFNGILLARRDWVSALPLIGQTGFVHMEILDRLRRTKTDFALSYKPVNVRPRQGGRSKTAHITGIWKLAADIVRLRLHYWHMI